MFTTLNVYNKKNRNKSVVCIFFYLHYYTKQIEINLALLEMIQQLRVIGAHTIVSALLGGFHDTPLD